MFIRVHPCFTSRVKSEFMRAAIRLSCEKMRAGEGGPFGAVVVRRGKIIGRGWNRVTSTNDPTAHAEMMAIRDACRRTGSFRLDDCQLYASCEPCPMCLAAAYWARIGAIFHGATRRDAAAVGFDDDLLYREMARPVSRRKISAKQLLRGAALKVLREWEATPDKVRY